MMETIRVLLCADPFDLAVMCVGIAMEACFIALGVFAAIHGEEGQDELLD